MFTNLIKRQTLTVLGINTGTSIDSIDLAVARISRVRGRVSFRFLEGFSRKFPNNLRQALIGMAESETVDLDTLIRTDNALGQCLGRAALFVQKKMLSSGVKIDLVASHGQTIRHTPQLKTLAGKKQRGSLQIGAPGSIAAATMLPVAADFRQADIALGNEGAPITAHAMAQIYNSTDESRLIVNIGGMSNYFYIPSAKSGASALARDCGPGNILSDSLMQTFEGKRYDRGGKIALSGFCSKPVLQALMTSKFFSSHSRSTGREEFGRIALQKIRQLGKKKSLSKADIMATAVELTVRAIVAGVRPILRKDRSITKLYLTGGGRKNNFFVTRLRESLIGIEIVQVDELGIDGDYIEACAFALMGEMTVRGIASPTLFDGKSRQRQFPVLGSIFQPPQKKV